ncbi:MAG: DUF58 domain-containing protein [Clostridia bacterium]|nr:DUF58 domain-containing protein [Clostridia bacterium]
MWRFRIVYLSAIIGTLILHLVYDSDMSKYIFLVVCFLPLFSLLLSLYAMLTVKLRLSVNPRYTAGQPAFVTVHLINRSPIPAGLVRFKLRTENAFTGLVANGATEGFYGAWTDRINIPVELPHSGRMTFTPLRCYCTDCMGLFAFRVRGTKPVSCYVYPAPIESEHELITLKNLKLRLVPKRGGGFSEEHEMRPYREGDPIRNVHWKLSSKWDELIIREPMEIERKRISVLIELKGSPSALDRVIGQLISLSKSLMERGLQHQILNPYAPTKKLCVFTPDNETQLFEYIRALLSQRGASGYAKPKRLIQSSSDICFRITPAVKEKSR